MKFEINLLTTVIVMTVCPPQMHFQGFRSFTSLLYSWYKSDPKIGFDGVTPVSTPKLGFEKRGLGLESLGLIVGLLAIESAPTKDTRT